MKRIAIIVGLVALVGSLALTATPALAAQWVQCVEKTKGGWEDGDCTKAKEGGSFGTEDISETLGVSSSFKEMEISDEIEGKSSTVRCEGTDSGWIAGAGSDVKQFTFSSCKRTAGACEAEKPVTVTSLGLPWETELIEETREVRDLLAGSGEHLGFKLECTVLEKKEVDECSGVTTQGMRNNSSSGTVEREFGGTGAEKLECSASKKATGALKGIDTLKAVSGRAIKIQPAPSAFMVRGVALPQEYSGTLAREYRLTSIITEGGEEKPVTIKCTTGTVTAMNSKLEANAKLKEEITLSGCTVIGLNAACTVPNFTQNVNGTIIIPDLIRPGIKELELTAVAGKFAEVKIAGGGACGVSGMGYVLTGAQTCLLPLRGTPGLEHIFECNESGSSLTLAGRAAKLSYTETVRLESRAFWWIV
jgi:hypothetical protein